MRGSGAVELRFLTAGDATGEVLLSGPVRQLTVDGASVAPGVRVGEDVAYVLTPDGPEIALTVPAA